MPGDRSSGNGADAGIQAELDALHVALTAAETTNVGFPAATDFDIAPLTPFLRFMLNNLGDPDQDGRYPHHTKPFEREALDTIADLLRAPTHDRWSYITSGASEGNEHGLHLARTMHPAGVVYRSAAAHHSIANAVTRLGMDSVVIRADETGDIDHADLAIQVDRRRHRPAIVVACIGTPLTEAVDDVRRITATLDDLAVTRRWIHADAALTGIPLALLDPTDRPGFDFADGATSMVVSGHKFLGSPVPYGVFVVRDSHRPYPTRPATYTGSADSPLTNSRSGFAALILWYTLRTYGLDGLRTRATQARELAAHTHQRLTAIGWPALRHPHAFTVVLATPPPATTAKWPLPNHGLSSQIVCMPGLTRDRIDAFITDLQTDLHLAVTPPAGPLRSAPRSRPADAQLPVPKPRGRPARSTAST